MIFLDEWNKYALGSYSAWEMETLCFYYHEHELTHINFKKYNISNYFDLPEEPIVERTFYKGGHQIPIFALTSLRTVTWSCPSHIRWKRSAPNSTTALRCFSTRA